MIMMRKCKICEKRLQRERPTRKSGPCRLAELKAPFEKSKLQLQQIIKSKKKPKTLLHTLNNAADFTFLHFAKKKK